MARNPDIETFRGLLPRCRQCGELLKPNYKSEREYLHEMTGRKREFSEYINESVLDAPEDPSRKMTVTVHGDEYHWSPHKRKWWRWAAYGKVKSRKFLGTFGKMGDSLFCNENCGWRWAVEFIRTGCYPKPPATKGDDDMTTGKKRSKKPKPARSSTTPIA